MPIKDDIPKERMRLKDWVAIAISSIALFVSLFTAYFNVIRQSDDLRGVLQGQFYVRADPNATSRREVQILSDQWLTMISSGNRAVAVSVVEFQIKISQEANPQRCVGGEGYRSFQFVDFKPLSIKPSEVAVLPLRLKDSTALDDAKAWMTVGVPNYDKMDYFVVACLAFAIVTPDNAVGNIHHVMERIKVTSKSRDIYRSYTVDQTAPFVLVRNVGTIFSK